MNPLSPSFLAFVLLAAPGLAQIQWTVDDDGPADFPSVSAAVAGASAGDVLLIQPGTYGPVTIDKRLTLLGDPNGARPKVASMTISGAVLFQLSHLHLTSGLIVENAPGRSRIDDCLLWGEPGLTVVGCAQLVVQRSELVGFGDFPVGGLSSLVDGGSRVVFVDSRLEGGNGYPNDFLGYGGTGGDGLHIANQSQVVLAGTSVIGGYGQPFLIDILSGDYGTGGNGIVLSGGSTCDIRGASTDVVAGGFGSLSGPNGWAVLGGGATSSGISVTGSSAATVLDPPLPFLYIAGDGAPGGQLDLSFHGASGSLGLAVTSFQPLVTNFPGVVSIQMWLNPTSLFQILPFALAGQDVGVGYSWPLPTNTAFAGTGLTAQGFVYAPLTGEFTGTNPAEILLTF